MPDITVIGSTVYADGIAFATLHEPDPVRGVSFTDMDRIIAQITREDNTVNAVCPLCDMEHEVEGDDE